MGAAAGKTRSDYVQIASALAQKFAADAAARDRAGGTPKKERDLIRRSGLLKLTIPREHGGDEQPWSVALAVVRELAKADGSVAHLFGYHLAVLSNFRRLGTPAQAAYYLKGTAEHNWFWGNTSNARPGVSRVTGRKQGEHILLNGSKKFTTGTPDADYVSITWEDEETGNTNTAAIPAGREGVLIHDDWDGIGQRQTGSGTVTFDNVVVKREEVLEVRQTGIKDPYYAPLTQSVLTHIYLGNAQGALEEAKGYIAAHALPYILSKAEAAGDDPYLLRAYGELWAGLKAAESLAERASDYVDRAYALGHELTLRERGETAAIVTAANVVAGKTALDVTSRIFELTGTRSATTGYGLDRYWRNVRIHTLHNPVDYKLRHIGHWALNGKLPPSPVTGLHT